MVPYLQRAGIALLMCCLMGSEAKAAGLVQITSVSDFSLPNWSIGDSAPTAHIDVCVYSTGTTQSSGYNVTAMGSSGFNLVSGTHQLPYSLYWDDGGSGNLGASGGAQMTSGAVLANQVHANTSSSTCGLGLGGMTARLNLKIASTDMTAALAGTYTGSVTILIAAN